MLDHQDNFFGTLLQKNFDVLATRLSVLYNYFNSSTNLLF